MAQINSRDMAQSVELSDAILTVEEAAVFCRVSGWAMYKRAKNGTAPAHYLGRRIYFLKSELVDFVRQI